MQINTELNPCCLVDMAIGLLHYVYHFLEWIMFFFFYFSVLFILFINDLLASTSSRIHSFADDTFLSSSFSFNPNDHASTDIQLHRNISASLLSNDLTVIEKWGKDNLVSFNQSKTKQAVISRKRNHMLCKRSATKDKFEMLHHCKGSHRSLMEELA